MSNHDIPADLPDDEAILLVLVRRMHEEHGKFLTRVLVLNDAVSEMEQGPRRQLVRLQTDHALDRLIQKGYIEQTKYNLAPK